MMAKSEKSIKIAFTLLSLFLLVTLSNHCFLPCDGKIENIIQRDALEQVRLEETFIKAIKNGTESIIKTLIEKVSFDDLLEVDPSWDDQGNRLLHLTLSYKAETAQLIMDKLLKVSSRFSIDPWSSILKKSNKLGLTPAHRAVKNDTWFVLEPALKKVEKKKLKSDRLETKAGRSHYRKSRDYKVTSWKRFIDKLFLRQDVCGNTPLHYALLKEHIDEHLVKTLIVYCPQACTMQNKHGQTPISLAVHKPEILAFFTEAACGEITS